jgi:hypothetical protein
MTVVVDTVKRSPDGPLAVYSRASSTDELGEGETMRILVAIGLAALLAACVSTSEVVPAGKDSYMIVGRAQGGMNAGKSKIESVKEANT